MDILCLDEAGCLFLSPKIEDWGYAWDRETAAPCDRRLKEALPANGIALKRFRNLQRSID